MTNIFNFGLVLDEVLANTGLILANQERMMSTLSDLQAADAAIKAAVAAAQTTMNEAVTLIQTLSQGGTVPDAQIESIVADLNTAASSLGTASTALGGVEPAPAPTPAPPAAG